MEGTWHSLVSVAFCIIKSLTFCVDFFFSLSLSREKLSKRALIALSRYFWGIYKVFCGLFTHFRVSLTMTTSSIFDILRTKMLTYTTAGPSSGGENFGKMCSDIKEIKVLRRNVLCCWCSTPVFGRNSYFLAFRIFSRAGNDYKKFYCHFTVKCLFIVHFSVALKIFFCFFYWFYNVEIGRRERNRDWVSMENHKKELIRKAERLSSMWQRNGNYYLSSEDEFGFLRSSRGGKKREEKRVSFFNFWLELKDGEVGEEEG
jgi:hypothetical protein